MVLSSGSWFVVHKVRGSKFGQKKGRRTCRNNNSVKVVAFDMD